MVKIGFQAQGDPSLSTIGKGTIKSHVQSIMVLHIFQLFISIFQVGSMGRVHSLVHPFPPVHSTVSCSGIPDDILSAPNLVHIDSSEAV